jgi:predicted secreted protein
MGPITSFAVFLTLWWTVLFAVLPIGARSYSDAGIEVKDGGDPGAPVNPNLKKKFITTTWIAAVLWVILMAVIKLGLVTLPPLAQTH